jgi:hypothetical protein
MGTAEEDNGTMSDHTPAGPERPVQPEIPRSRFALGMASYPPDMEDLHLGSFGEGERTQPATETDLHRGRFSEGQEVLGDEDPEKHIRRRFSEGQERHG